MRVPDWRTFQCACCSLTAAFIPQPPNPICTRLRSYGELGNAELVKKYGFALRQNPFTAVGLDKRRLLAAARAALGPRRWKVRAALLRDQTEVLDEDEEPFEVRLLRLLWPPPGLLPQTGIETLSGRGCEGRRTCCVCVCVW